MYYGSKEWANDTLRYGIELCKGKYTYGILGMRIFEIEYYIKTLKEKGFWWQAERLSEYLSRMKRNHKGVKPKETVPKESKPKKEFDFSKPNEFKRFLDWLYDINGTK